MKQLLPLLLAFLLFPPLRADERRPVGLVQKLEVTSLTKDRILLWVRAALPRAAKGWQQYFRGRLEIANVDIPFRQPARVTMQPGGAGTGLGADGVFFVDVELAKVPDALLSHVGAHALDLILDGVLGGDGGEPVPVFAVGVLRFGTPDVKTPAAASPDFLRFAGARLTDVSFSETSGEATVVLFNPFSFAVPVRELSYQLDAGGRTLATGVKHAVRLRPRQETTVTLPVTAKNVDLAAAAGSALRSHGVVEGRLTGHFTVKLSSGDVTVPLNLPGRVEIGK